MSPIVVPERAKTIMAMLSKAADDGAECPSNGLLASAIDGSITMASNTVSLLETMNLIRVVRGRDFRIVTIVATGKSTRKRSIKGPKPLRGRKSPSSEARAAAAEQREANRRIRIGLFGDALSEGASIIEAGRVAGVSEPTARSFFKMMCAELGWLG